MDENDEDSLNSRMGATDPSLEFDRFEIVRLRLVESFVEWGHPLLEAERIALYVVEGVRSVPRLLKLLSARDPPTQQEILVALGPVLDNSGTLERARRLLLRLDGTDDH